MSQMTTEEYIRDAAKRGWSKAQVRDALGLCRETFYAILEAMPPLQWPARGKSLGHRLANEARLGVCSPALRAALERNRAVRKERSIHVVHGRRGTIEELAQHYAVSGSTVRRRRKSGLSLEAALTIPPTQPGGRRKGLLNGVAA